MRSVAPGRDRLAIRAEADAAMVEAAKPLTPNSAQWGPPRRKIRAHVFHGRLRDWIGATTGRHRRRKIQRLQYMDGKSLTAGVSVAEFARQRDIHPNLLFIPGGSRRAAARCKVDRRRRRASRRPAPRRRW